ncbi:MAG: leucine-rich repeat domain-containing protein [Ginsengibacter sp.]
MRLRLLFFSLFIYFSFVSTTVSAQGVSKQDSLALVDLYNSTNGPNWVNHTNWLTSAPASTWFGVLVQDGDFVALSLGNNGLIGKIPSSIVNLEEIYSLDLSRNQLSGKIPDSIGNISQAYLDLSYNQLDGPLPASLNNFGMLVAVNLSNNKFTFSGLDALNLSTHPVWTYSPQQDIPLRREGNILSVSAGGTLSNNTYKWYRNGTEFITKTGDSTLTVSDDAYYSVEVTNKIATVLTLYSIDNVNQQDSLALVALYNSTGGSGWINNQNWLSSSPVSTWHGVTVRHNTVISLDLNNNNLTGTIPSSIENLSGLTLLALAGNSIGGEIPSSISNLNDLSTLSLATNKLSGTIPSSIGQLSNLSYLNFGGNQLTGNIPIEIGNLSSLSSLYLSSNKLTGQIPSEIGNLPNLNTLYLSSNQLEDTIPYSMGNLPKLSVIHLENNKLTGIIPSSFGRDLQLTQLYLSNNLLTGDIPDSLCQLKRLARLVLSNNQLTGKLPDSLNHLTLLFDLEISNNKIEGTFPSLANLTMADLYIDNNKFTFDGLENIISLENLVYSPQATIPLTKRENLLSVTAGGTLPNDTFHLYRNGILASIQVGDSVFSITNTGPYYISVTNGLAKQLTLYSDTLNVGISLADTTIVFNQVISGSSETDINDGIFKILSVTPTVGTNALNGNITATVTIDSVVSSFHGQPYVQRHYDISPTNNAEKAQATVTLYFTQQDFDNFNSYVRDNNVDLPLLPTGGVDNGNVRVIQLHGSFTTSPDPGNYDDSTTVFITPTVFWDNTNKWWVVSFPVTGFSGFFISTANFSLPLTLLQFEGKEKNDEVMLHWLTTNEVGTKEFIIERSVNVTDFNELGNVTSKPNAGNNNYYFTDSSPAIGNNYYRLKMVDIDGSISFSNVVFIKTDKTNLSMSIFPNPVKSTSTLKFYSSVSEKYIIKVLDQSGKTLQTFNGISVTGTNKVNFDVHSYPTGTYFITLIAEKMGTHTLKIIR